MNFKKAVAHQSIRLYGFSIHQKMGMSTSRNGLFIAKTMNALLPKHLNDPEVFELVKTYQVHAHSRTCWKLRRMTINFTMVDILLIRQLLQNHFILNLLMKKTKRF